MGIELSVRNVGRTLYLGVEHVVPVWTLATDNAGSTRLASIITEKIHADVSDGLRFCSSRWSAVVEKRAFLGLGCIELRRLKVWDHNFLPRLAQSRSRFSSLPNQSSGGSSICRERVGIGGKNLFPP